MSIYIYIERERERERARERAAGWGTSVVKKTVTSAITSTWGLRFVFTNLGHVNPILGHANPLLETILNTKRLFVTPKFQS